MRKKRKCALNYALAIFEKDRNANFIKISDLEYPFAGNRVWAHRWASFYNTHHTTTIQPNAPRINRNTPHMVKFMKTISFGCET